VTTDRLVAAETISPWTQGQLLGLTRESDHRSPAAAA